MYVKRHVQEYFRRHQWEVGLKIPLGYGPAAIDPRRHELCYNRSHSCVAGVHGPSGAIPAQEDTSSGGQVHQHPTPFWRLAQVSELRDPWFHFYAHMQTTQNVTSQLLICLRSRYGRSGLRLKASETWIFQGNLNKGNGAWCG